MTVICFPVTGGWLVLAVAAVALAAAYRSDQPGTRHPATSGDPSPPARRS
ncbi:hypothetical protein ACRS6B_19975 [Nocardia asteroides]